MMIGPGAFAQHHAAAIPVERTTDLRRIAISAGNLFLRDGMHDLHRVQSRAGRPADHGVGISAADDLIGLADGQVGTGLAQGQRIARPAKIVENRHVAGGHVGQILEQPQGRHLGQAFQAPAGKLELARRR